MIPWSSPLSPLARLRRRMRAFFARTRAVRPFLLGEGRVRGFFRSLRWSMTMRCSSCQFDNPPAMKFCGQCGAQLAQLCPRCGAENQPTFKFCGQCGAALPTPQSPAAATAGHLSQLSHRHEIQRQGYTPPHLAEKILRSRSALEGERRRVTVLFVDVAGFTPLAEQLDPEEVHQIMDRSFELITAEVHRAEVT